jgi:hypothetical protein
MWWAETDAEEGELDGVPVEMAFWYLRAQRR